MFKKLSALFLILSVCACGNIGGQNQISMRGGVRDNLPPAAGTIYPFTEEDSFKAAMLLPLSGKSAAYGRGLKNAALMAVDDADNPHLSIRFYDTRSSRQGAEQAVRQALDDNPRLILGPLTSSEVSAISSRARSENVPVISFSTSPKVLEEGIYTLGLLGDEQIERVISYAAGKGRNRIAVLVPDTPAGINMAKAAYQSAPGFGAAVVKIGFYPPETLDFSEIVKSMTDYADRSAEIAQKKNRLKELAKKGDAAAARELKKLKTVYTTGEVDFDAVLIPETGSRLKSAASMFSYYDVAYPQVLFLGTSVWENTNLTKETTLYHGVYPVISRTHNNYFTGKYQDLFEEKPNQLYSFAYDAVALASALSKENPQNLSENITDSRGYTGINGTFRIFPDGTNRHSLDIVEVTAGGPKVVSPAAKSFDNAVTAVSVSDTGYVGTPRIFGKDSAVVMSKLTNSDSARSGLFFTGSW